MSLPFLSDSSFVSRIILDSWRAYCGHWASRHRLMADCHPHSTLGSRICHGLPCPISARHLVCSPFPQTCLPVLGSYQVLAHLKITWFASSHLCPPPGLLTLPTQGSSTWLAGWGVNSWVVWVLIECELPVTSPIMLLTQHHLPYVFFHHPSFFFASSFWLCFLGGWEAVNPGQVRGPPAAIVDSFYLHIVL